MRNILLLTYETWKADSICSQISKPWGIGYIPSIKRFIKFQACRLIWVIIKTTRIFFHRREIEYLIFLARLTNYKYVWFVQVKINYWIFQWILSYENIHFVKNTKISLQNILYILLIEINVENVEHRKMYKTNINCCNKLDDV